jgi:hypothetical protein
MEKPLMKLDLRAALSFILMDAKEIPLSIQKKEEYLLCYNLNPGQSRNIEPDREQFLGNLVFIGHKTGEFDADQVSDQIVTLPQGHYLFMQQRSEALNQVEWLDMAIEQQKDGLWERNKLGDLLFVRFLHEDDAFVTQVFRVLELV